MQSDTLTTDKLIWNGVSIWYALAACVQPHTTHITGNHAFSIINFCATAATHYPIFKPACNQKDLVLFGQCQISPRQLSKLCKQCNNVMQAKPVPVFVLLVATIKFLQQ